MDMLWVRVDEQDGLIHSAANCLALARDGSVWVGTSTGISCIKQDGSIINFSNELFDERPILTIHIGRDETVWAGSQGAGLFQSKDKGQTWSHNVLPEDDQLTVTCIAGINDAVWVGTISDGLDLSGLFVSKDGGASWAGVNTDSDLSANVVGAICPVSEDTVFVGLSSLLFTGETDGGLMMSADGGSSWTNFAALAGKKVNAILANSGAIWVGTENDGLFISRDFGAHWISCTGVGMSTSIKSIAPYNSNGLLIATDRGAMISQDDGVNWQPLPFRGSTTVAVRDILYTPDGSIWAVVDRKEITVDGGVYVGKCLHPTEIAELPPPRDSFKLVPNYPNPFEHRTTLTYKLPYACSVTLEVYDTIGKRIAVLVNNQFQPAGEHTAVWHVSGRPSGVYFLQLRSDTGLLGVRKIVLF